MFEIFRKLFAPVEGGAAEKLIFHPTQTCPECGSRMCAVAGSESWACPNPDCPVQVRRGLVHWCSAGAMDIPGCDEAMAVVLVKSGLVRDVAELYRLKLAELAALPELGSAKAQPFFNALMASKQREAWRVIYGLNIPSVGVTEAQAMAKTFATVDIALSSGVTRLMSEADLSEAASLSVVRWYGDGVNRKILKRLEKFGVNLKAELGFE